jgi:type IV pilus assembly protein PilF
VSKALSQTLVALCLGVACALPAQAQYDYAGPDVGQPSGSPRARAKIHTELGAMYFQAGNMAVALEELRIALDADSRFFQAYSVRGLVHGALKEYAKAEADFRGRSTSRPNDPESTITTLVPVRIRQGTQSSTYFLNALKSPLYETPERRLRECRHLRAEGGRPRGRAALPAAGGPLSRDGRAGGAPATGQAVLSAQHPRGGARLLADALRMMEPPTAEALWLGVRLERKLGNRANEGSYAAQLRSRYPTSPEYQEFLKGNFE